MDDEHTVWASSFADPADVRAFRRCKAAGHSDKYCFNFGDNGIGYWGEDVSEGSPAACALPPEVAEALGVQHNDKLLVTYHGNQSVVFYRDHMPSIEYLERKGRKYRIDLNPTACEQLGLHPPVEALVTWRKL